MRGPGQGFPAHVSQGSVQPHMREHAQEHPHSGGVRGEQRPERRIAQLPQLCDPLIPSCHSPKSFGAQRPNHFVRRLQTVTECHDTSTTGSETTPNSHKARRVPGGQAWDPDLLQRCKFGADVRAPAPQDTTQRRKTTGIAIPRSWTDRPRPSTRDLEESKTLIAMPDMLSRSSDSTGFRRAARIEMQRERPMPQTAVDALVSPCKLLVET